MFTADTELRKKIHFVNYLTQLSTCNFFCATIGNLCFFAQVQFFFDQVRCLHTDNLLFYKENNFTLKFINKIDINYT